MTQYEMSTILSALASAKAEARLEKNKAADAINVEMWGGNPPSPASSGAYKYWKQREDDMLAAWQTIYNIKHAID